MFNAIASSATEERASYFNELVPELVRHEVAEEVVVYPAIRSDAPDGEAEVEPRLREQSQAEKRLAAMEDLDPSGSEFAEQLEHLRRAVLEHAKAEEDNIFPLLRALEGPETRFEMGGRYEKAKASAPTHPHPAAPDTSPANKVVGPIAAIFDRARDAVRGL